MSVFKDINTRFFLFISTGGSIRTPRLAHRFRIRIVNSLGLFGDILPLESVIRSRISWRPIRLAAAVLSARLHCRLLGRSGSRALPGHGRDIPRHVPQPARITVVVVQPDVHFRRRPHLPRPESGPGAGRSFLVLRLLLPGRRRVRRLLPARNQRQEPGGDRSIVFPFFFFVFNFALVFSFSEQRR